jgi:hypothetical protein
VPVNFVPAKFIAAQGANARTASSEGYSGEAQGLLLE